MRSKSALLIYIRSCGREALDHFAHLVINDPLNQFRIDIDQPVDDLISDLSKVDFAILKNAYYELYDLLEKEEIDE